MATKGVYALLPHAIGPIMRQNWTGSEETVDDVAIPEYVHGMFSAGYLRAHPTPRAEAAAAAVAARGAIVMVAEVLHDAGDGPEAPLRDADGAEARPADRAEAKADSIYKEDAETRIKGTRAWLLSGNFASDLLLARKVFACTGPPLLGSASPFRTKLGARATKEDDEGGETHLPDLGSLREQIWQRPHGEIVRDAARFFPVGFT